MKRTKVYRRDIPRTHSSLYHWNKDDEEWDQTLTYLEGQRFSAAKVAREDDRYSARTFYEHAREAIREVGGHVDDFPPSSQTWWDQPPDKRAQDMQRLLTRLSHTFNPEEKKKDGDGDGDGKGENQQQGGATPRNGEREEDDEEGEEGEETTYNGGGENRYGEAEDASLFYAVRYLISKLAEHDDFSDTVPFGSTRWDAKRVLSAYWDPILLEEAKRNYERQVDDIYLILDVSGSVDYLANNIAAIAAGAAGIVRLYQGQEARPTEKVLRSTPLRTSRDNFPEWRHPVNVGANIHDSYSAWWRAFEAEQVPLYPEWARNSNCFEADLAWFLYSEKPPKGSRILFWGDTQGADFACPRLLAALLRPYRAAWLLSEPYKEHWPERMQRAYDTQRLIYKPDDLSSPEWPKLEAVGIPVIENIQTAEHVRGMLQTLQMLS